MSKILKYSEWHPMASTQKYYVKYDTSTGGNVPCFEIVKFDTKEEQIKFYEELKVELLESDLDINFKKVFKYKKREVL
tara:strand:+ start:259 stop:492 length:234 start_codon:yes stop_codon:yes gene_type:complete